MGSVTLWCPLIHVVLLLPCRWCCAFPHCTKCLQNERLCSNPKLSMDISGVWPFLALEYSMNTKWMSTEILDITHLHVSSKHCSVTWLLGKARTFPQPAPISESLIFFSKGKFRANETEKVIQIPWQVKTTGTPELFAKPGPYSARARQVLQRSTPITEIAKKVWFKKNQWPTGRQHKAVVYCSQPSATLTKLQEVSFAQYSCKTRAFSY